MEETMSSTTPALSWEILDHMFSVKSPATLSSTNGVVSSDVSIDTGRDLWFRLYAPSSAAPITTRLPVVVYFHGGGFNVWSPDCRPYDDLCRTLASESQAVVVSVNYRLTPQHRCPAQYEDGFEALRFLDRHATQSVAGFPCSADLGKCIVAGDSAGGNLAHHVAVRASECQDLKISLMELLARASGQKYLFITEPKFIFPNLHQSISFPVFIGSPLALTLTQIHLLHQSISLSSNSSSDSDHRLAARSDLGHRSLRFGSPLARLADLHLGISASLQICIYYLGGFSQGTPREKNHHTAAEMTGERSKPITPRGLRILSSSGTYL